MIDHNIMRFDITMHYALWMTVIKGFQQFVQIIADIVIGQSLIKLLKIYIYI